MWSSCNGRRCRGRAGQLAQLASCEYLERAEDIVIAGPIGTGKTHLTIALGVQAARRRHRVAWHVASKCDIASRGYIPPVPSRW